MSWCCSRYCVRACQSIVLLFPLSNYYYYYNYIALLDLAYLALCRVHKPINSIVRVMPSHRHSPALNRVHLVFMPARVHLSSDIGLFLAERLSQYPGLANVDSYPIIVLCRIFTYFYEHEQSSSLSQPVSWPRPTNELGQTFTLH